MRHDHDGKTSLRRAPGYISTYVGENIAYNQGYSDPASNAVAMWLGSPGHLGNIENGEYNETGVGVYRSNGGKYYFCQVFGKSSRPPIIVGSSGGGPEVKLVTIENGTGGGALKYRFYLPEVRDSYGRVLIRAHWSETFTVAEGQRRDHYVQPGSTLQATEAFGLPVAHSVLGSVGKR